jgi:hypothetical protein
VAAIPCADSFSMNAGLTLSADTVPRTESWNILFVRDRTLCGPLYGGSSARRVASCRGKTCVESWRCLWTKVAGGVWRAAGIGLRGVMCWRS